MADIEEQLREDIRQYLRTKGVESTLAEVPSRDLLGRRTSELAIKLLDQPIDCIRTRAAGGSTGAYGRTSPSSCSCYLRVVLNRPLTKESKKALSAVSHVIRERSLLSMFTFGVFRRGKVLEVRWDGGRIAESLNLDTDLSRMLVKYADDHCGDEPIWIAPEGESWVEIHSPMLEPVPSVDQLSDALPFELYWRIAEHVRRLALI